MLFTINGPEITTITPDSAYVGDVIGIAGTKLGSDISAVKVYFNSIPATEITEIHDTYVKVKVPPNAVSGNVYVEINGVASNSLYFIVISETPVIDRIEPSSALPGNYIYLFGNWKPTSTTPPNTYLKIGGVNYPIDPKLNWNAYSYLKLLLPEEVATGIQEVSLIYDGKESNKTNLYIGIPLETFLENPFKLRISGRIYLELLKPDQSTTSTILEVYSDSMNVQWDERNFSSSYMMYYFTEDFSGKISDDGMSIVQLTVHKKYLNNSGEITLTLKADESIPLDSVYYSYYTSNLYIYNYNSGPDYLATQEDLLSKFNITGTVELIPGEVCTIQSIMPKPEESSYFLIIDFK